MARDARFAELLEELRSALAGVVVSDDEHAVVLGELLGTLAASADVDSLHDATSTAQVRLRKADDDGTRSWLLLVREVLRSASLVRAGDAAGQLDREAAQSVRERVLGALAVGRDARSSDIAAELSLGLPQVSRALSELASAGLATRSDTRGLDGRARYWRLSPVAVQRRSPYAPAAVALGVGELDTGQFRNDLLPLGPSDRVELAAVQTMITRLAESLEGGRYKPMPAELFRVAKDGDTTRPGALLRLPDRVVYTALVRRVAAPLAGGLSESVLWPRGGFEGSCWEDFERSPLESDPSHIVVADVASFYDTVDHAVLGDSMLEMGSDPSAVGALLSFLGATMQRGMGLPQGLPASDPLATAALAGVDVHLERAGIRFTRHGDDYRFPVHDRFQAREAIAALDEALRSQRLHLNNFKTHTVSADAYQQNLLERAAHRSGVIQSIRRIMGFETGEGLLGEGEGFNPENDPGLDELGRLAGVREAREFRAAFVPDPDAGIRLHVGRYGEVEGVDFVEPEPEEIERYAAFEALMVEAESTAISVAERLLEPRQGRWLQNSDRHILTSMLSLLSAGSRPIADGEWWATYLLARPQDTRAVGTYLAHLADAGASELPAAVVERSLDERFSDWQRAWLLSALAWAGPDEVMHLQKQLYAYLERPSGWLTRLEVGSLLQRAGLLSSIQLSRMWAEAPPALRSDLVVLLSRADRTDDVERVLRDDADDAERCLVGAAG